MMCVEYCVLCEHPTVSIDHVARKKRCSTCSFEYDYNSIQDGGDVHLSDLTNPLQSNVTTEPKNGSSDDLLSFTSGNSQNRGSNPVSISTTVMNTASSDDVIVSIADMSDRLGLPAKVKNEASEFFKKVEAYYNKGKSGNALIAGCIYIACRGFHTTRSMEEISSVANGATISEIVQAVEFVAKKLNLKTNRLMDIKPADFIKRFCSNLGIDSIDVKLAQIAAESYECEGRSPVTVAAGIAYSFARRSYEQKLLKEIGDATGVSAQTIIETSKDLNPYLSAQLPNMAAKRKEMENTLESCLRGYTQS